MKTAIVTLSDTGYFHLLEELVDSVHSFKESNSVSICVLDAGMKEEQLKIIKSKVYSVKKAKWDISVNTFKVRGKRMVEKHGFKSFSS